MHPAPTHTPIPTATFLCWSVRGLETHNNVSQYDVLATEICCDTWNGLLYMYLFILSNHSTLDYWLWNISLQIWPKCTEKSCPRPWKWIWTVVTLYVTRSGMCCIQSHHLHVTSRYIYFILIPSASWADAEYKSQYNQDVMVKIKHYSGCHNCLVSYATSLRQREFHHNNQQYTMLPEPFSWEVESESQNSDMSHMILCTWISFFSAWYIVQWTRLLTDKISPLTLLSLLISITDIVTGVVSFTRRSGIVKTFDSLYTTMSKSAPADCATKILSTKAEFSRLTTEALPFRLCDGRPGIQTHLEEVEQLQFHAWISECSQLKLQLDHRWHKNLSNIPNCWTLPEMASEQNWSGTTCIRNCLGYFTIRHTANYSPERKSMCQLEASLADSCALPWTNTQHSVIHKALPPCIYISSSRYSWAWEPPPRAS